MASQEKTETSVVLGFLKAAWWNGFGFQADGIEEGWVALALCQIYLEPGKDPTKAPEFDEDAWTIKFREKLGTELVAFNDFIGRKYVKIHYTLYYRTQEILQMMLDDGLCLTLLSVLEVFYKPGDKFIPSEMESKFIAVQRSRQKPLQFFNEPRRWKLLCERNWETPEGKAFCREVRPLWPMDIDDDNKCDYRNWPIHWPFAKRGLFDFAAWGPTAPEVPEGTPFSGMS